MANPNHTTGRTIRNRDWIWPATTVDHETKIANGRSWIPLCSASAPRTPWKNCGRIMLAGMKAAACRLEAMRKRSVVRTRNARCEG
jgi:hypothetical protein